MDSTRKSALVAGVLYLVTHVASIAGRPMYDPLLNDPDYILGTGADTQVLVAALLEVFVAIAVVGTAVALYPIVKRQNEGIALGYVGLRTLESSVILVGVTAILGVVTLRQNEGDDSLAGLARVLVSIHEWTFLIGPNFVLSVNTMLIAHLVFRSGLVPRFIGVLGLVGGVMIFTSALFVLFGAYEQTSVPGLLLAIPVFAWELSFALWLIFKGFTPSGLAAIESVPLK